MRHIKRWKEADIARLRDLAASGMYGVDMAAVFGVTFQSILTMLGREKIPAPNLYTPAQQEQRLAIHRAKAKRKYDTWKAKQAVKESFLAPVIASGTSRTHPIYRNQLPKLPESTTKFDLRRMIAEAARNTAEMSYADA